MTELAAGVLILVALAIVLKRLGLKTASRSTLSSVRSGMERVLSEQRRKNVGAALETAGVSKHKSTNYLLLQVGLTAGGFFSGLGLLALGMPPYLVPTLALLGFFLPGFSISRRAQKRRRAILLGLPYYLDLLTLALEAGLDLIAAVEELASRDSPNPLQEELLITLKTIRMGEIRSAAFSKMAERTGVEQLSLLAGCVTQSEELGASLGHLLRLQAEGVRREIYREAEERAQRAPVKMLIPLIGLIFPVVFVLLFAPLALRFMTSGAP